MLIIVIVLLIHKWLGTRKTIQCFNRAFIQNISVTLSMTLASYSTLLYEPWVRSSDQWLTSDQRKLTGTEHCCSGEAMGNLILALAWGHSPESSSPLGPEKGFIPCTFGLQSPVAATERRPKSSSSLLVTVLLHMSTLWYWPILPVTYWINLIGNGWTKKNAEFVGQCPGPNFSLIALKK